MRVHTVRVVLAGSAVWTLALVVLLLLGDRVDPVWTWTCRRHRPRRARPVGHAPAGPAPPQGLTGHGASRPGLPSVRMSKSAVS